MTSATGIAVDVDYADRYGLVATRNEPTHVVGHGMYMRSGRERAEVAFAIADELQGHGLGTILLAHLAELADEAGITTFEAEVLPENHRMIEVFRESGFLVETSSAPGSIHVLFPTSFSPQAIERFEGRERIAAAAAVARFFRTAVDRRDRRLARAGHGRRRAVPQPARGRFPGPGVSRQLGRRGGPVGAGLSIGDRRFGAGRARGDRRAGHSRRRRGAGVRREGRPRGRCDLRRLRRGGAGRHRAAARAARHLSRGGHQARGAELPRGPRHATGRAAERDLRAGDAPCGKGRFRLPERCAGSRDDRARHRPQPRDLLVRVDRKPGRHHPKRPARVLGGATLRRPSHCSTSNRSATRDASHTSRAASAARSRSWP